MRPTPLSDHVPPPILIRPRCCRRERTAWPVATVAETPVRRRSLRSMPAPSRPSAWQQYRGGTPAGASSKCANLPVRTDGRSGAVATQVTCSATAPPTTIARLIFARSPLPAPRWSAAIVPATAPTDNAPSPSTRRAGDFSKCRHGRVPSFKHILGRRRPSPAIQWRLLASVWGTVRVGAAYGDPGGRMTDGRRDVWSTVMICTMAYRPLPKTRFLVEPPPAVLVAPDIFGLAVRELEITPEGRVSNRGKAAFNLHQARKAHALLRGVDWSVLTGSGSRAATSGTDDTTRRSTSSFRVRGPARCRRRSSGRSRDGMAGPVATADSV